MNLKNLQYFEKLIELKSFSKTGNYFHVNQPTISMGIKRLEKELGSQLVVHDFNHNELILTSSGKTLHKYSKTIVDLLPIIDDSFEKYQKN